MKYVLLIILACAFQLCLAQELAEISLDNLEIPDTPAFILLDEAPSTIQRPNSTRAFALDLLQNIKDNGGVGNIAVEVTPFWMMQHTNMSPEKFYGIKTDGETKITKQNPFAKLRMTAISAAYIKTGDSIINASFGIRTTVFEIKRAKDIKDYKAALSETQQFLSKTFEFNEEYTEFCKQPKAENFEDTSAFVQALEKFIQVCGEQPKKPEPPFTEVDREVYKAAKKKYEASCLCTKPERDNFETDFEHKNALSKFKTARDNYVAKRMKETGLDPDALDAKFQKIINRKPAIAVDLAVAFNQRFYGNTFNNNSSGRFGIWSTVAASAFLDKDPTSSNYVNIYGFVRYLNDSSPMAVTSNSDERFNAFDIGIKGELEFKKLIMAYEYINRSGDMEGYRSVGTIRYQLWNDMVITGSFGNNFELTDDLVTLFGIKWGINHPLQKLIVPKD